MKRYACFCLLSCQSSLAISQLYALTAHLELLSVSALRIKCINQEDRNVFPFFPIFSFQVLPLKTYCKAVMGLLWFSRLILITLVLIPQPSLGCPSGCRCYSLTVECGSLGVKEIPQGIPSVTEVSWTVC